MNFLNWLNSEEYAFTEDLSAAGWAWEFLRRNPGYQSDWIEACDAQEKYDEYRAGSPVNPHRNPYAYFIPALPLGKTPDEWAFNEGVEVYFPAKGYGKKWLLQGKIHDPKNLDAPVFEEIVSVKTLDYDEISQHFESADETTDVLIQRGTLAVISVDLTQTDDSIKKWITAVVHQERSNRQIKKINSAHFKKRANWKTYLQILDARAGGVPIAKIGLSLFPNLDPDDSRAKVSHFLNNEIPQKLEPEYYLPLANF